MLSRDGNENGKKKINTDRLKLAKKKPTTTTLLVQHTFLYISLPLFCTTTTWNVQKLPSYTFYGGKVVFVPVHLFIAAAYFHLGGRLHFSFSHRRDKIFMFFFLLLPCFFILRSSSFSVIHVSVDIKIESKERTSFVVASFFFSKSPGGQAIYRRNVRVLDMQNFTSAYLKGWTYVRTDYFLRTKISLIHR